METLYLSIYAALLIFGLGVIIFVDVLGLTGDFGEIDGDDPGGSFARGSAALAPVTKAAFAVRLMVLCTRILRFGVYASVAAGSVGLIALFALDEPADTLPWSIGSAFGGAVLAWLIFKLRYQETNSLLKDQDVVGQEAAITMSLQPDGYSQAVITVGQTTRTYTVVLDESAPKKEIGSGAFVRVTRIDEGVASVMPIN